MSKWEEMAPTILNKGNKKSLINFQEQLTSIGLLRMKPFFKKEIKKMSLQEFVIQFINVYNEKYKTYNTFEIDKEGEHAQAQCAVGCRRSAGDLFRISKYYYPETTLEDILIALKALGENGEIRSSMCHFLNKRVYYKSSGNPAIYDKTVKDEFNRNFGEINI